MLVSAVALPPSPAPAVALAPGLPALAVASSVVTVISIVHVSTPAVAPSAFVAYPAPAVAA